MRNGFNGGTVSAQAQRAALISEFERRHIELPSNFDVPDSALWALGYAAEAGKSLLYGTASLDEALEEVRPFIDPVLADAASGTWDPVERAWT